MASLVAPLACGVVGAVSGSATFFNEGTGTPATVYSDPEGVTVVTSHVLDANGGIVRYVNNRVDVVVKNASAATVRTFTWGTDARETRVENAGFTGTLAGGGTAPGGRTTVDAVLTALFASFGAIDGKVLVSGSGVNLSAALAGISGIVFNVKTYGAVGNGSTDDRAAIVACIAAAISAGGGIIFFPPGTYKILGQITVPTSSKVTLLGASETSVRIIQHTTATNGWFLCGADSVTFQNMTFGRNAAGMTGRIIQTAGKVNLLGCTFESWGGTDLYFSTADTSEFNCHGCTFIEDENIGLIVQGSGANTAARFANCTFRITKDGATVCRGATGPVSCDFANCNFLLTGQSVVICSDDVIGRFSDCTITGTAGAGNHHIGDSGCTAIHLSACTITSASSIALGGLALYEAGCSISATAVTLANPVFQSEYRDHTALQTTLGGATVAYTASSEIRTHFLQYPGTNVGTLTLNTPTDAQTVGTRVEFVIYHSGASGPSALAWGMTTFPGGGAALPNSIAMGAVATYAFVFSGTTWVLVA